MLENAWVVKAQPGTGRRAVAVLLAMPLFLLTPVLGHRASVSAATPPSPLGHPSYLKCTLWGGAGNDTLVGTPGNDVICGQAGNDVVRGRGGRDRLYGGPGNDVLYGGNTATGRPGTYDDKIYGDEGNDRITAGAGADHLEGHAGNDVIQAGAGDDYVKGDFLLERYGPNGSDTLYGGPGSDYLAAGGGDDFVDVGTADSGEIADGGSGSDVLLGGGTPFFNSFRGGSGSDLLFPATLRTSPLGNHVTGGEGNDIAILINGMMDGFTMGPTARTISVPVPGDCQVNVPVSEPSNDVKHWGVSCKLIGPISIKVDGRTVSLGSEFYSQSLSWDPRQWRRFANQGSSALKGDLCLCDLPMPPAFLGDQIH